MIKFQYTQQKKRNTTVKKIFNQKKWVSKHNKQNALKIQLRKTKAIKMGQSNKTIQIITLNAIVVLLLSQNKQNILSQFRD